MRFLLKLTILGLAGYGAYVLWERYGASLGLAEPERRRRRVVAPGQRAFRAHGRGGCGRQRQPGRAGEGDPDRERRAQPHAAHRRRHRASPFRGDRRTVTATCPDAASSAQTVLPSASSWVPQSRARAATSCTPRPPTSKPSGVRRTGGANDASRTETRIVSADRAERDAERRARVLHRVRRELRRDDLGVVDELIVAPRSERVPHEAAHVAERGGCRDEEAVVVVGTGVGRDVRVVLGRLGKRYDTRVPVAHPLRRGEVARGLQARHRVRAEECERVARRQVVPE